MEQVLNGILCSDKKYRTIFNTNVKGKLCFLSVQVSRQRACDCFPSFLKSHKVIVKNKEVHL